MIPISIERVDAVISLHQKDIFSIAETAKTKLSVFRDRHKKSLSDGNLIYLSNLIRHIEQLVTVPPVKLEELKRELGDLEVCFDLSEELEKKAFKNQVLNCLGYSVLRTSFFPKFFRDLGIKACVYCNAQLTVAVEEGSGGGAKGLRAKFQLDHYYPKSRYPGLSISLFNLYPTCASCNNIKGSKEVEFQLYQEKGPHSFVSPFQFEIPATSIIEYFSTGDAGKLKVKFLEPTPKGSKCSFQETFAVEGIYATQVDIAEDLIVKAQIYTDDFKESLINDLGILFGSSDLSDRIILGNYAVEEEIHQRPLAKFMQDLAKQFGLIS